jgi:hypothetical protein
VKRSGKDHALAFRRLRKCEDCEAKARELAAREGGIEGASPAERKLANFKNHGLWLRALVDWVVEQGIPGVFAFDSYFTNAPVLVHIASHSRSYVRGVHDIP